MRHLEREECGVEELSAHAHRRAGCFGQALRQRRQGSRKPRRRWRRRSSRERGDRVGESRVEGRQEDIYLEDQVPAQGHGSPQVSDQPQAAHVGRSPRCSGGGRYPDSLPRERLLSLQGGLNHYGQKGWVGSDTGVRRCSCEDRDGEVCGMRHCCSTGRRLARRWLFGFQLFCCARDRVARRERWCVRGSADHDCMEDPSEIPA